MAILEAQSINIVSLAGLIEGREISPVEVVEACLERIQSAQPRLNAFLTILEQEALQAARRAEAEILKGRWRGLLHGIPFAAKDLYCTAGVRTTCGSRILADFVPDHDAAVVARLKEAGAILVGKSHMHEFAFGATNLNEHYGPARNPWNTDHVTGGSSGGSGAALAAALVPLALGSDTGGSIRIPAALCGAIGLKPTFGRISKFGVFPLAWSLDCAGPMTRTAADAAVALQVMAGYDPRDPCTRDVPVPDYRAGLDGDIRGLRLGVPDTFFFDQVQDEVRDKVDKALAALGGLGAKVRPIHIPGLERASASAVLILNGEAAAVLEEYRRTRPGDLDRGVKARLDAASLQLTTDYLKAQRVRRQAQQDFARVFGEVDALVVPATSLAAPRLDQAAARFGDKEVPVLAALTRCNRIFNLVGLPSLAVPVGLSEAGLPLGMQIAGRPFDEATILRLGHAYQSQVYSLPDCPPVS